MTEGSWEDYLRYAHIFAPAREEQFSTILSLIPGDTGESFLAVDLGCGGGDLSAAILKAFPSVQVIAADKTDYMLEAARQRLAEFGKRAEVKTVDLHDKNQLSGIPDNVKCFVSSVALHHLSGQEKQDLYKDLYNKLTDGGGILIADMVEPVSDRVKKYYGDLWDEIVKTQSKEMTGTPEVYDYFKKIDWNYFQWEEPDEEDTPSGMFEQLKWLERAGFKEVDCFWLRAGHAVYGGYK